MFFAKSVEENSSLFSKYKNTRKTFWQKSTVSFHLAFQRLPPPWKFQKHDQILMCHHVLLLLIIRCSSWIEYSFPDSLFTYGLTTNPVIIIINFGCGLYKKWWDSDVTAMFAVVCVWISALDINKDFHEKSNFLNFTLPKYCACGLHRVDMAQAFLGHWCLKIFLGYEQVFF